MFSFDALNYPYASRRNVVYANRGMVATSQPLAAQAGLRVLQAGGNAMDAAVATAAALTVVEPTANGIGGDAFALVWHKGKLHGLNASGPAPQSLTLEKMTALGHTEVPKYGPLPITVPGTPAAWAALSERFGRLPLGTAMAGAIELAQDGFPVSPSVAFAWQQAFKLFKQQFKDAHFQSWFDTFAPERAPQAGEMWRSLAHAQTLQSIAESRADSFYRGAIAERICQFVQSAGGYLSPSDLADYRVDWCDPISVNYRGYDVWEIPPNGHGLVALMALNILQGFEFTDRDSLLTHHRQIEAIKLAFADGFAHIAEPAHMRVSVSDLLSAAYAKERQALIGARATLPLPGEPSRGGTVYLCTADKEGNMVSFIQSNYMGFGSGMVVPGTGISLHNRGNNFSLKADHPNCLAPGKRPYHTIIPGFLTKNGQAVGPFGVMGGFMQPQGHVQMVMNTVDFGLNPQAALDAPRWEWETANRVNIERSMPEHLYHGLARLGHEVSWSNNRIAFGRGQIIWRNAEGVLCGGTEPRTDGAVAAW
ncbi:gamma-glutamyltransferase family protein [Rhodoferax sp.]|uniref:gamma-glutamyltransferase family protein n=1 Tax=Rhodoferax sp. TaxID=50421 RepID=UPI0008CA1E71|nr:gamma-glutamyltransferase family protein [Rhodoferax sp.]MDO8320305.1 gamma-glutamyltransferase family protein [Rhodoferax sp.]MDP2678214.1 gamma-glutamyltransferase family protein [Rhodoferax sp.]OGB53068.1 MAG: gamma-glutamyltransferase [Burkholderiales bacterium RIFOXYD12_FULL_59_19]OGB80655.1 MAG: gamma-glutamyltransferase [Burkholderiales bacterium RIFOXYC12_FULL_60_6]